MGYVVYTKEWRYDDVDGYKETITKMNGTYTSLDSLLQKLYSWIHILYFEYMLNGLDSRDVITFVDYSSLFICGIYVDYKSPINKKCGVIAWTEME